MLLAGLLFPPIEIMASLRSDACLAGRKLLCRMLVMQRSALYG